MTKLSPQLWMAINANRGHKSLIRWYEWPFEILTKVENMAYSLALSDEIKVHLVWVFWNLNTRTRTLQGSNLKRVAPNPKRIGTWSKQILNHKSSGDSQNNRRVLIRWIKWAREKWTYVGESWDLMAVRGRSESVHVFPSNECVEFLCWGWFVSLVTCELHKAEWGA